jgi:hypothetical protein
MKPRLGFYGAVAVCAWAKGHSGSVREVLRVAPRREQALRRRRALKKQ